MSLKELDVYRFKDAPAALSQKAGATSIGLDDLKMIVEWKM